MNHDDPPKFTVPVGYRPANWIDWFKGYTNTGKYVCECGKLSDDNPNHDCNWLLIIEDTDE